MSIAEIVTTGDVVLVEESFADMAEDNLLILAVEAVHELGGVAQWTELNDLLVHAGAEGIYGELCRVNTRRKLMRHSDGEWQLIPNLPMTERDLQVYQRAGVIPFWVDTDTANEALRPDRRPVEMGRHHFPTGNAADVDWESFWLAPPMVG